MVPGKKSFAHFAIWWLRNHQFNEFKIRWCTLYTKTRQIEDKELKEKSNSFGLFTPGKNPWITQERIIEAKRSTKAHTAAGPV